MSKKYEKLKTLLKELFQLDQPDLDFGLYRIMHAKSAEITQFLDRDLLPQVRDEFAQYKTADKSELEAQLAKVIAGLQVAEVDPDTSPKVKELREKIASDSVDIAGLESEVYDHLYGFFRRYYSEGDFLSKRVYKSGVYAIPYEGEEVKLHWANADQYYIKTSEYLRDYAFRLHPDDEQKPMRVHFRLVDAAEGEHGNVKAAEGKDRIFILASKEFAAIEEGEQGPELVLRFEYRPATLTDWPDDVRDGKKKPPTQKEMIEQAVSRIMDADGDLACWITELGKPHEKADGELADYSRLRAHLNRYVARNTFDYFIHKDLGTFLRRELDFYIKNEVMHLDDIEGQQAPRVEQYLSKIRVIRRIATKIITFLAHLEDFQKKLWLKKKFVVETNYCITLDRVPEELYPEIAANDAQREEWVRLFAIDKIEKDLHRPGYSKPVTVEFLKSNPHLLVDTQFFSQPFVAQLVDHIDDLDSQLNGILMNSDNYHALHLIHRRFKERIGHIYIDPPYNTDSTPILYRNGYRDSSWISLMQDRLRLARTLMHPRGVKTVAIDDTEVTPLSLLLTDLFPEYRLTRVTVVHNPKGSITKDFNRVHEYALFLTREDVKDCITRILEENDTPRKMRRWGENSLRTDRRLSFYPIYVKDEKITRIGEVPEDSFHPTGRNVEIGNGEVEIWPIDQDGVERRWNFGLDSIEANLDRIVVLKQDDTLDLFLSHEKTVPKTVWTGGEFDAGKYGNTLLINMLGKKMFDFPKSINLVEKCISSVATVADEEHFVLDYFAGSGTTAHAVLNLNRTTGERRKFLLVEMGQYCEAVTKARIQKAVYSNTWNSGTPEHRNGMSGAFKYVVLESYEDALNNLQLRRSKAQQTLLDAAQNTEASRLKEQYMLGYMLNVETEGSQSLLNVQAFADPTAYKLKVKRPGSDETREVNVDLLETFNWLIGLAVQHTAAPRSYSADLERDSEGRLRVKMRPGSQRSATLREAEDGRWWFRTVKGKSPEGQPVLIIWRNRPSGETPDGVEQDNLVLDAWFQREGYSSKDSEFSLIYVNGTNNLENLRTPEDQWKVRLIEEDFHRLMFAAEGV